MFASLSQQNAVDQHVSWPLHLFQNESTLILENNSRNVPGMVWANILKKQTWGTDLILNWPCLKRRLFNKSLLRSISSHLKFKFSQVSVMRFVVKSSQMILSIWNKKWFHHRSSCPRSKLQMNTWKTIQFPWDVCFLPSVLTYLPLAKILKMYPTLEPQSGFWKLWRIHN